MASRSDFNARSMVEFDYACAQHSVDIIAAAIDADIVKETLPTRCDHFGMAFTQFFVVGPTTFGRRFAAAVQNAFNIFTIPCSGTGSKSGLLAYRIIRLVALDPLYILSGIVMAIGRAAAGIFGFFIPCLGARIFKLTQQLETANLRLKAFCHASLVSQNVTSDRLEYMPLIPSTAQKYLGSDVVSTLAKERLEASGFDKKTEITKCKAAMLATVSMSAGELSSEPPALRSAKAKALSALEKLQTELFISHTEAFHDAAAEVKGSVANMLNALAGHRQARQQANHEGKILRLVKEALKHSEGWERDDLRKSLVEYQMLLSDNHVYQAAWIAPYH